MSETLPGEQTRYYGPYDHAVGYCVFFIAKLAKSFLTDKKCLSWQVFLPDILLQQKLPDG